MLAHDAIADVFGDENIIALHFDDALHLGLSELDALLLSHVGLPRVAGTVFTTDVEGVPELFAVQPLDTPDGGPNMAVFLGAPGEGQGMRYFLDVNNSLVVLCSLGDDTKVEVINSSFSHFVDFVHRIGVYIEGARRSGGADPRVTRELAAHLEARDPYAFRAPDSWWSMVLAAIREQVSA